MKNNWYERWMSAYEQASFYKTEKNEAAYWNAAAKTQSEGLSGKKHIDLIVDYLSKNKYLDENILKNIWRKLKSPIQNVTNYITGRMKKSRRFSAIIG